MQEEADDEAEDMEAASDDARASTDVKQFVES